MVRGYDYAAIRTNHSAELMGWITCGALHGNWLDAGEASPNMDDLFVYDEEG